MSDANRPFGVTEREDQVLRLVSYRVPLQIVGEALDIRVETVRAHIKRAGQRMGVSGKDRIAADYVRAAGEDELTKIWVHQLLGKVRAAAYMIERASPAAPQEAVSPPPEAPRPVETPSLLESLGARLDLMTGADLSTQTPFGRLKSAARLAMHLTWTLAVTALAATWLMGALHRLAKGA